MLVTRDSLEGAYPFDALNEFMLTMAFRFEKIVSGLWQIIHL
jgi:hypothetical protein